MEVKNLSFGMFGNEEIRDMAVMEVTDTNILARGRPKEGGVVDSRLGSVSNYNACATCLDVLCTSHTGFIQFDYPIPHVCWLEPLLSVANSVCVVCAALIVQDDIAEEYGMKRLTAFGNRAKKLKSRTTSLCLCPACGIPQPLIVKDEPFYLAEWPSKTLELFAKVKSPKVTLNDVKEVMSRTYTNWTLSYLLRSVSEVDQRKLGLDPTNTTIDGMMLRVMLVPGNITRLPPPCDDGDSHGRGQHQLSQQLSEIVKQKRALQAAAEGKYDLADPFNTEPMPETVAKAVSLLWWTVSRYFRKDKAKKPRRVKVSSYAEKGHKNAQSVGGCFDGKEGLLRNNNTGKRVDFSSRTVIGGDTTLDVDEIGVPRCIARTLTVPITITQWNRKGVKDMIMEGKVKQIIDPANGSILMLVDMIAEKRVNTTLINGWVAERFLQDGDLVIANRQPTLHRNSILAHRVKVIDVDTFKLNPCCVEGYNADFDGDEMVIHVPQTVEARAEMELMYCVNHMFHPRKCAPIFSLIQDGQVGWHMITRPDSFYTRQDVSRLMAVVRYDPSTPEAIRIGDTPPTFDAVKAVLSQPPSGEKGGAPLWSGLQLASSLLPPFLHVRKGGVVIKDGVMVSGTFNKTSLGASSESVVHQVLLYGGGHTAARMLSDMQRVADKYLLTAGFSIRPSDFAPSGDASARVQEVLEQACDFVSKVRKVGLSIPPSSKVAEAVERKTCEALRQILVSSGNVINNTTTDENAIHLMASTVRSKGSTFNMAQMMGAVSQTFVMGERPGLKQVRRGIKRRRRNMPNQPLEGDSDEDDEIGVLGSTRDLKAHGFVGRPFVRGLTFTDVCLQSSGGREGLVDTTSKTPISGYIQRQLVTACIDAVVQKDLTVRDSQGFIISNRFALDGANHTQCVDVVLELMTQTNADVKHAVAHLPPCVEKKLISLRDMLRQVRTTIYSRDALRNNKALLPFDAAYLLSTYRCSQCGTGARWDPSEVVHDVCETLREETNDNALFVSAHLWWTVCTSTACRKCVQNVLIRALDMHRAARMYPGEAVGALAASSCGEISTQLTLSTFHFGATGMGGAVGVPRVEEIMNGSKNIATIMSFEVDGVDADELQRILPHKVLKDVVEEADIVAQGDDDADLVAQCKPFLEDVDPLSIRFVLNKQRTVACGLDAQGVASVLRDELTNNTVVVVASQRREETWVVRLFTRLKDIDVSTSSLKSKKHKLAEVSDMALQHVLRALQGRLMDTTRMCGVKGVELVATRRDVCTVEDVETGALTRISKTLVDVKGSHMMDIMLAVNGIQPKSLQTNDIMDVHRRLGIDCAAFVLFHELYKCISGSRVAEHIVKMIVDCITYRGDVMSVNRHGINKTKNRSVLAKMAFEEAVKQITEAALLGSHDELAGVVERSIAGKKVMIGSQVARLAPTTSTSCSTAQRDFQIFNDPPCVSFCEEMYDDTDTTVALDARDEPHVVEQLFSYANTPWQESDEDNEFRLLSPVWRSANVVQESDMQKRFTMVSPPKLSSTTD